jgi:hypothetical protein
MNNENNRHGRIHGLCQLTDPVGMFETIGRD